MAMTTPAMVMIIGSMRSRGPVATGAAASRFVARRGASSGVGRDVSDMGTAGVGSAGTSATGRKPSSPRIAMATPRTSAVDVTMNRNGGTSVMLAGWYGAVRQRDTLTRWYGALWSGSMGSGRHVRAPSSRRGLRSEGRPVRRRGSGCRCYPSRRRSHAERSSSTAPTRGGRCPLRRSSVVERVTVNHLVVGSNPTAGATPPVPDSSSLPVRPGRAVVTSARTCRMALPALDGPTTRWPVAAPELPKPRCDGDVRRWATYRPARGRSTPQRMQVMTARAERYGTASE